MHIVVALVITLHALLHLLGFLKSFGLAALPELSGHTVVPLTGPWPRVVGMIWLFVALVLLSAAAMRALRLEDWWIVAIPGVVLSQLLIVLQWQDAKAGSAANLLIAAAIIHALIERAQRR